jgi:hypothetical protein
MTLPNGHLIVNTIEFAGRKAVINSYSGLYLAALGDADIVRQRETWADRFPNATVRTETMSYTDCTAACAIGHAYERENRGYSFPWVVGEASKAAA